MFNREVDYRLEYLSMSNEPELSDLQKSIQRTKIARATASTSYERLRAGADLYDEGMQWLIFAVRGQNPGFTPEQVDAEIERRKKIIRRIDDNGIYKPCGNAESDVQD